MMKKLFVLGAMLAATLGVSTQAQAAGNWYFLTLCGVPNAFYCPTGPDIMTFGPYPTLVSCSNDATNVSYSWFGMWPRATSTCWEE